MEVYRVEHRDTLEGPYRTMDPIGTRMARLHNNADTHPSPNGEYRFCNDSGFLCAEPPRPLGRFGFVSLNDLLTWFSKDDLRLLKENNFVVNVYEVPDSDVQWIGPVTGQCSFDLWFKRKPRFTLEP